MPPKVATVACLFCSTLNRVALDRVAQGPRCGSCGRPILLDRPLHVAEDTFQQVLDGTDIPVLVDFYAYQRGRETARQTGAVPRQELDSLLGRAPQQ